MHSRSLSGWPAERKRPDDIIIDFASFSQGDNGPATEDETAGGEISVQGLQSILFKDAEADDGNADENYEAAVWAKVILTELSTRKLGQRQEKTRGDNRAGAGRSRGGDDSVRKKKKKKRTRKTHGEVRQAEDGCRGVSTVMPNARINTSARIQAKKGRCFLPRAARAGTPTPWVNPRPSY